MERDEQNRKLAEWVFGRSLDGFGIFSRTGQRLRDRDFDSIEEAQRYIDAEDERLQLQHKSSAHGVQIQPCVKSHPNFYTSEEANALLLEKMAVQGWEIELSWSFRQKWSCVFMKTGYAVAYRRYDSDRKTAACEAARALIEGGSQ